jgi:hypothetical protein
MGDDLRQGSATGVAEIRAGKVCDGVKVRDPGWRPIAVLSLTTSALVVFLLLPWDNATFLIAIVIVFAWIASVAVRQATYRS